MDDIFSRTNAGGFGMSFDESAYWLEADFLLTEIVSQMVNLMRIPLGATLFIKGAVVTGMLVSEQEYLKELSAVFIETAKRNVSVQNEEELRRLEEAFDFTGMAEESIPSALKRQLETMAANSDEAEGEGNDFDEFDDLDDFDDFDGDGGEPIRYLHLREMVVLTPSPSLNFTQGVLPIVRIRLNSIDAWILGQATTLDTFEDMAPPSAEDSSDEILH